MEAARRPRRPRRRNQRGQGGRHRHGRGGRLRRHHAHHHPRRRHGPRHRHGLKLAAGRHHGGCDHITFKDCLVERNLGIEDSSYSRGYNNIGCLENGATASGSHLDSITFIGCHIGVSNGRTDISRNIGCPRMSMEFYTAEIPGVNRAYHGWSNVEVIDCVFEASDVCCIDLADTSGYVIRTNVFALYVDNGITPGTHSMVLLRGSNHVFTGITITTNSGSTVLELQHSSNSSISGNTFRTAATTDPVIHYSGTNSNNTLSGNVFPHN